MGVILPTGYLRYKILDIIRATLYIWPFHSAACCWFIQRILEVTMAKRQGNRMLIKMKSTESSHYYHTEKNRQNHPDRLELKKFDPTLRKHVLYREDR